MTKVGDRWRLWPVGVSVGHLLGRWLVWMEERREEGEEEEVGRREIYMYRAGCLYFLHCDVTNRIMKLSKRDKSIKNCPVKLKRKRNVGEERRVYTPGGGKGDIISFYEEAAT